VIAAVTSPAVIRLQYNPPKNRPGESAILLSYGSFFATLPRLGNSSPAMWLWRNGR
jgi:hypothetical protein